MTDRFPTDDPLLAAVLAAATAPAEAPMPGEEAALAAFRAEHDASADGRRVRSRLLVAAAVIGGTVMVGGMAAAASGVLPFVGSPRPVESPAVPGDLPGQASPTARPTPTPDLDEAATDAAATDGSNKGRDDQVTDVARNTASQGPDKGVEVCRTASEDACAVASPPATDPPTRVSRPGTPTTAPERHRAPGG